MSTQPQAPIQKHLCRPTTTAAARRSYQRLISNANSQVGDIVNVTGDQTGKEVPGGGGGGSFAAHATRVISATGTFTGSVQPSWTATSYDIDTWFSVGTPTRITVDRDGVYLVEANILWANMGAATVGYTVGFKKNGSTNSSFNYVSIAGNGGTPSIAVQASILISLTAADYIEAYLQATSGSVDYTGISFSVTYLGSV